MHSVINSGTDEFALIWRWSLIGKRCLIVGGHKWTQIQNTKNEYDGYRWRSNTLSVSVSMRPI